MAADEGEFTDAGEVLPRGIAGTPAGQRWFWEPDWQAARAGVVPGL